MEIQDGPPPDQIGGDGPPPPGADKGSADSSPQMDPQEAIAIIQKLGIPPDALPILAKAIEALEAAGAIPGGDEGPPKKQTIDDALGAAMKQHGMPAPG